MNRKLYSEEGDTHEVTKISRINSDIKRALFSNYIWTHDLHTRENIPKRYGIGQEKQEEIKLATVKSQGVIEKIHTLNKKLEDEDNEHDEKKKIKYTKKKTHSIGKLSNLIENIDKLISQKKNDYSVLEKVDEMCKEIKNRKINDLNKYQDMYYELFTPKTELPLLTTRKNQDFLDRVKKIQSELRPQIHSLPILFEHNLSKVSYKVKGTKVLFT
jgi:DNA repair ATPase RecN